MTGKQGLGLEDDKAGIGADAACSDADAQPGGDTEAGRDANGPRPANAAASARRRGGEVVVAGGRRPAERMRRRNPGMKTVRRATATRLRSCVT